MKLNATSSTNREMTEEELNDYRKFGGAIVLINWLALLISTLIGYFKKDFVPWVDQ